MSNLFGRNFRIMTFGESHGSAIGVIIDGLPAGLKVPLSGIQNDIERRCPGQPLYNTQNLYTDQAEIISGLTKDGRTNGAPLAIVVKNKNSYKCDCENHGQKFRPGHADWTWFQKYGLPPQPGGGRPSSHETIARIAAGSVARLMLEPLGIKVSAYTVAVGQIKAIEIDPDYAERDPLRFADRNLASQAHREVETAMSEGDSVGSVVEIMLNGVPAGWGEPIFDKLSSRLGAAFFSIGSVRAVEFGEGLSLAARRGSEANDPLGPDGPLSNRHGGLMGGISTGLPIIIRLFIRPTPPITRNSHNSANNHQDEAICADGGYDPCLAIKLAPVAEAMALLCLADFHLEPNRNYAGVKQLSESPFD